MSERASSAKRRAFNESRNNISSAPTSSLTEFYLDQIQFVPQVGEFLNNATLKSNIRSASDYSYSAQAYSGDHFRLVGDAAGTYQSTQVTSINLAADISIPINTAFIDPFFSSGVHLAFTGGLAAACTIAASRDQTCSEQQARKVHDLKIGTAYTR